MTLAWEGRAINGVGESSGVAGPAFVAGPVPSS